MLAALVAAVLTSLGGMHVYWAFGGGGGSTAVVPEVDGKQAFRPGPVSMLAVAALLLAAATLVAARGGWFRLPGPQWVTQAGVWVVAAVFAARTIGDFRLVGLSRKVKDTPFAEGDRWIYTPLCMALAFGCTLVALS